MNDVILSPNCWQLCDRSMIEIERIPDQRAVKVRGMLPLAESCSLGQGPPIRKATGWETQVGSVWVHLKALV